MVALALYQPDIPQNVGASMRLCACLGIPLHVIEPCGFPWDERKIRQAGMDYIEHARVQRHSGWQDFQIDTNGSRIILMTSKSDLPYYDFTFEAGDILLAGQESSGAPGFIHESADARVTIPMAPPARSLNIVNASAMILGEAIRQTR